MNKKKYKKIIFFVVMFIFMFSTYFGVRTYAMYKSRILASGNTDIAKWEFLSLNDDDESVSISAGGNASSYLLKVTNKSEVSSLYSLRLSNLPSGVQISIDDGSYNTPVDGTIVFNNIGMFNASDADVVNEHIVSFKAPIDMENVSNNEIDVDITFTQKIN